MKVFLFLSAFLLSIGVFGQTTDNITPVQAGTIKLVNGKATVQLDETTISSLITNAENNYFVTLTPVGNCGALKLGEKGNKSFTVTCINPGYDNASFDYIVFLKYQAAPLTQGMQPVKTVLTPGK